ncbi:MAG: ABC transporter permease [Myxococcales bacterium]|nr:MAG: ABC transporter permease [Myxococcales bacterium]
MTSLFAARFWRKAWAFVVRDFLDEASYKLYFFLTLWGVVFAVLVFFFLSRVIPEQGAAALAPYGGRYFPFVLVGFAMAHYLELAMHGLGRRIREGQLLGTLEALFVTRTPAWQILFFLVLYPFLFTSLMVMLYLALGWAFFGVDLSHAAWGSALAFFLLTGLSLAPLGILSAALILLVKRGDPVSFAVTGLSYLLSGVFYPVEVMPGWLQTAAQFFPLTHSLEGLRRSLLAGAPLWEDPFGLAVLLFFAAGLLPFSLWVFGRALAYARRTGGLHHY